jgi:hypothetical protein
MTPHSAIQTNEQNEVQQNITNSFPKAKETVNDLNSSGSEDATFRVKYCYCGYRNKPGSKFCTRCGNTIKDEYSEESYLPEEQPKTEESSAPPVVRREKTTFMAPVVCSCGKIVRDGSAICPRCGKGLK